MGGNSKFEIRNSKSTLIAEPLYRPHKSLHGVHWNVRRDAVAEVGDVAVPGGHLEHRAGPPYNLRVWSHQDSGVEIALQGVVRQGPGRALQIDPPIEPEDFARKIRKIVEEMGATVGEVDPGHAKIARCFQQATSGRKAQRRASSAERAPTQESKTCTA